MVTMGTKRVLDESAFSGQDDAGDGDQGNNNSSSDTGDMLREDEPIDVFNPVCHFDIVFDQVSEHSMMLGLGRELRLNL